MSNFKFLSGGALVGVMAFLGVLSTVFKAPLLGAFLSDPATAETATAVASGIVAIVAGAWQSYSKDRSASDPK